MEIRNLRRQAHVSTPRPPADFRRPPARVHHSSAVTHLYHAVAARCDPGAVSEKARSTVHAAKHGQHMDNHGQTMALIASGGLPAARLARLPHPWEGRARGERGEEACVDGGRSPCSKHGSPHLNMALIAPGRPGIAVHAANIDNPKQNMALIAPGGRGGMGSPAARPSPSSWTCTAPWPRSLACPPPPSSPISTAPTCGHFVFVV